mmetsp:Transcript_91973/g.264614  ORF Transcript_91973/g.264614 Transcript_91973/m.264614 type:complete len:230 (-) Transcript_91973:865-1554(-)
MAVIRQRQPMPECLRSAEALACLWSSLVASSRRFGALAKRRCCRRSRPVSRTCSCRRHGATSTKAQTSALRRAGSSSSSSSWTRPSSPTCSSYSSAQVRCSSSRQPCSTLCSGTRWSCPGLRRSEATAACGVMPPSRPLPAQAWTPPSAFSRSIGLAWTTSANCSSEAPRRNSGRSGPAAAAAQWPAPTARRSWRCLAGVARPCLAPSVWPFCRSWWLSASWPPRRRSH